MADIADHYRRVLCEMVDIGADLLRMVHREAEQAEAARLAAAEPSSDPSPAPAAKSTADLAAAYDVIFRAMRRAILLDGKLAEPPKAASRQQQRIAARKKIFRDVEDAIARNAPAERVESLHAELIERMDSPDIEDEIATRTIPEIVQDMCRDFGIAGLPGAHPWQRRVPLQIAILNARAEQMAGAPPSEKLIALLAAAHQSPPRRTPGNDPPPKPP